MKKFDDLNALAGTWSEKEAQVFERNTATFAEVDAALLTLDAHFQSMDGLRAGARLDDFIP